MITDSETNFVFLSDSMKQEKYSSFLENLERIFKKHSIRYDFLPGTKDIWVRDYMPVQVSEDRFIEFRYDPDYLQGTKKGRRNLKTCPDIICDAIGLKTIKTDIILDGGNLVFSNDVLIMTDKIYKENKADYTTRELLIKPGDLFQIGNINTLPKDSRDPYGHADSIVRFIDIITLVNYQ